jgi:SdiA-regulated
MLGTIAAATLSAATRASLRWLACACAVLALIAGADGEALAAPLQSSLVNTIRTSQWSPASPDPSGIAYDSLANRLLVVDGEVDEMSIFRGANYYEATLGGNLVRTANTTAFSHEPVGVAFNPGRVYITDDNQDRVFEVALGANGRFEAGDQRRSYSTMLFGSSDPEGAAYDPVGNRLFIADGAGTEIYAVNAVDGVFGNANDRVSHFDTGVLGISDPETVEFNPASGTLYLIGVSGDRIVEATTSGARVSEIDTSYVPIERLGGLAYAPSSRNAAQRSFYITDRKVDNDGFPRENDGTIYEVTTGLAPPPDDIPVAASQTLDPGPKNIPAPRPVGTFALAGKSGHGLRRALAKGIVLKARCSTACRVTARLHLRHGLARRLGIVRAKPIMVAKGGAQLRRAGSKSFRIKFTPRAKRRLKLLRKVRLSLHVTLAAAGGAARTHEVIPLVLRRR